MRQLLPIPLLLTGLFLAPACQSQGECADECSLDCCAPATTVLFDGSSLDAFRHADGSPATWSLDPDGATTVTGGGNLISREEFGDHRIELEFLCPELPRSLGIDRGNSGVYVQGVYEVQVLDSFEMPLALNSCGAIYQISMPASNACLPPEEWQSYAIDLTTAELAEDGSVVTPARMTVVLNGELIQDDVELPHVTPGGLGQAVVASGPLMLQDHNQRVRFRNIRVTPL
ncbi:MAG: DUF1080 domain-containing protein [Planctomycetota bacterium]|nr:DUF1080 domain-containing protein [Planctomycetota bacterium]